MCIRDSNISILKLIFSHTNSKSDPSNLRSLLQKVLHLIREKKVLNPQDGFRAIKLILIELLKRESSDSCLSDLKAALDFLVASTEIGMENKKIFFIQI